MGEVYEAEQLETGRRVALKVLRQSLTSDTDQERFLREGRLAASINHPNSLYVFGTEEVEGTPVIAMELLPGGTLKDEVRDQGPLSPAEAVDAILQVISGLREAAEHGVLHRDVKPSNCFVVPGRAVKVGDFGLSISTVARAEPHLTAAGTFLGTPAFASPEQVRCEDLDVRSDIYSVGATLYFLLTGRAPFEERNAARQFAAILEKLPVPPRSLRRGIPKGLERVVLRCLEKSPTARYESYVTLTKDLTPFTSAAPRPATLGLRLAAFFVDGAVRQACLWTVLVPVGGLPLALTFGRRPSEFLIENLFALTYFTLFEGIAGWTPGKALFRLRVVGPARDSPGVARALARTLIFFIPAYLSSAVPFLGLGLTRTCLLSLLSLLLRAAIFLPARARNGFAGIHEILSRTGVRQAPSESARPRLTTAPKSAAERTTETRLGPYEVPQLPSAAVEGSVVEGYDASLERRVWIRILPADSPPVSALRRDLARPGRLRWLNGGCSDRFRWDAYEAPQGLSLLDASCEHPSWASVRYWVRDLAEELAAGLEDGSTPPLALDRVWVTSDGRAVLLEFSPPGLRNGDPRKPLPEPVPADPRSAARLLSQVGRCAMSDPMPLHARELLVVAPRRLGTPQDFVEALRANWDAPPRISRERRALQMAATLAVLAPLLILLSFMFLATSWKISEADELRDALEAYAESPAEREPLERYIANRFRSSIRNNAFWESASSRRVLRGTERDLAKQIEARHAEMEMSKFFQDSMSVTPLIERMRIRKRMGKILTDSLRFLPVGVLILAGLSLLAALLGGQVTGFRLFRIAIVDPSGRPTNRLRASLRALATWAPVLGAALCLRIWTASSSLLAQVGLWVFLLAGACMAVLSIRHPERGLQDRLAGTCLVPK